MRKYASLIWSSVILLVLFCIAGCRKYDHQQPYTELPVVSTLPATGITGSGASSGGSLISDGGSNIFSCGVCWDIGETPDINDSHTSDGFGNDDFVSLMTNLNQNTGYFVRAYAKNSAGTGYGNTIEFKTTSAYTAGEYLLKKGEDDYFLTIKKTGTELILVVKNDTNLICTCTYTCKGRLESDPKNGLVVEGVWYKFFKTSGPFIPAFFVAQPKDSCNVIIRESEISYEMGYKVGSTYTYIRFL